MKTAIIRIVLIFLTCLISCIEPLDVEVDRAERVLVVEGFITTDFGPHRIKLTRSARFGSVFQGIVKREENAQVTIRDNLGRVTYLNETFAGIYETPPQFRAEIGKSYSLEITTKIGFNYYSLPEMVLPVPPIDSLIPEFRRFPSTDPNDFISGVEILAQWNDPAEQENYYLWQNSGAYIINTNPELYFDPFSRTIVPKRCCARCFITETAAQSLQILKDRDINGNKSLHAVAFIADDGGRFQDIYKATISQFSITKEAYLFFQLLQSQLGINGDIFDPPPAQIRGNMLSLENPDENIIGYFWTSDVTSKTITLTPDILEVKQRGRQINDDCLVLDNSSLFPPPGWN